MNKGIQSASVSVQKEAPFTELRFHPGINILWGADAKRKCDFIDRSKHLVLTSAHPSPLSAYRGFFGNHHFSLANDYLKRHNKQPIIW